MSTARKHYLTAKQLRTLRKALEEQRDSIEERGRETLSEMSTAQIGESDEVDQASNESSRLLKLRIYEREQKIVPKITKAIERLDRGEYGYCEACGAEVGFERLRQRPMADYCIDCKLEFEQRERRIRSTQDRWGLPT